MVGPAWLTAAVFAPSGAWYGSFSWTQFQYHDAMYVDEAASPVPGVHYSRQGVAYGSPLDLTANYNIPAGTYQMLVATAGDVSHGLTWASGGDISVETGSVLRGTTTYLYLAGDFNGPVTAGVQTALPPVPGVQPYGFGGGARINAANSVSVDAAHHLAGTFLPLGAPPIAVDVNQMQVTNPDGSVTPCGLAGTGACYFWPPLGSGSYTFSDTGAGAGISSFDDIALALVDFALPSDGPAVAVPEGPAPPLALAIGAAVVVGLMRTRASRTGRARSPAPPAT